MWSRARISATSCPRKCRPLPASRTRAPLSRSRLSRGLRRRLWTLTRRQGVNIRRHSLAVGSIDLLEVANNVDHSATCIVARWGHAVRQKARDVAHRPGRILMLQSGGCDVRHPPFSIRRRPAGESLALHDGAEKITRAVKFSAIPGAVHQVSAAVQLRGFRGIRYEWPTAEEQKFPQSDQTAHVERKSQIMSA